MRITSILPMCRQSRLEAMADQYRNLDLQNIDLDIILIVDNSEIPRWQIEQAYEGLDHQIIYTDRIGPSEANIYERRQRIADNLNLAKKHVANPDYVWLIEDDTEYPSETLQQLLQPKQPIVSAIQAGRHSIKILGLWEKTPTGYQTISKYQRHVDACGLYCLLIRIDLFKDTLLEYDKELPVGPDVQYTNNLNQPIHVIPLHLGHTTQTETIYPTDCQQISFTYEGNRWNTQIT